MKYIAIALFIHGIVLLGGACSHACEGCWESSDREVFVSGPICRDGECVYKVVYSASGSSSVINYASHTYSWEGMHRTCYEVSSGGYDQRSWDSSESVQGKEHIAHTDTNWSALFGCLFQLSVSLTCIDCAMEDPVGVPPLTTCSGCEMFRQSIDSCFSTCTYRACTETVNDPVQVAACYIAETADACE